MKNSERFRLLGTYRTPRVRIGTILSCECRDCDVIVVGYSDARIPWPVGRRRGLAAKALVLYGDLAKAVQRESNQAVCYWFGITPQTVSKWRKALGVGLTNDGTHRLRADYQQEPWAHAMRTKAQSKARDPQRRRKIAEAKRGVPRPAHVVDAMRKGRTGKPQPPHARKAVSNSNRQRMAQGFVLNGRRWTEQEDDVVRRYPPAEAARLTNRTMKSVWSRRRKLGLPDGRRS